MNDKKKDALFKPPERYVIFTLGHDVSFPGEQLPIGSGNESCRERILRDGYAVMVSIFPEEDQSGDMPPIGVLAAVSEDPKIAGAGVVIHLISRVRVLDPRVFLEAKDGTVFDCRIEHFGHEAISEETWLAAQKDRATFVQKLVHFGLAAQMLFKKMLADGIPPDDQEFREHMKKTAEEMSQAFADIAVLAERTDRESVHDLPNVVGTFAGLLFRYLAATGSISEGTWLEYSRELRAVLFERDTLAQLVLLGKFMDAFAQDISSFARRKPQAQKKDIPIKEHPDDALLPDYVREAIGRSKPYAESHSSDSHVHRQYIEWLRGLKWNQGTTDEKNIKKVRVVLNEDHFGLKKAKEKVLEVLAGRSVKPDGKGSILCFVGPPGVGKTSICKSIAKAMNRNYVRVSLGGVDDEVFIHGHGRTYVGALPGEIIKGMRRAGSNNPVFVLDEIDKLSRSPVKGSPQDALLQVLDPEQNNEFLDHYLDVPYDLSKVLFITTANTAESIPGPLFDRMEIIELPGYTEDQKAEIMKAHTIAKVKRESGIEPENLKSQGLSAFDIRFIDPAIDFIASNHTGDAGMRDAERCIATIVRKVILELREGNTARLRPVNGSEEYLVTITVPDIEMFLGKPHIRRISEQKLANLAPGVGCGLVYYNDGHGGLLFVRISVRDHDHFNRKITGHIGPDMTESVEVAITRLFRDDGVLAGRWSKKYIHVHFSDGAVPKDGPSAGILVYVALYSALQKASLKRFLAITGEIVNQGDDAEPVGGIIQKLLAARRNGIREVVMPLESHDQLEDFPTENVRIVMPSDIPEGKSWCDVSAGERSAGTFTVYCVEKPEDALEIAFPDHYPPK